MSIPVYVFVFLDDFRPVALVVLRALSTMGTEDAQSHRSLGVLGHPRGTSKVGNRDSLPTGIFLTG